jgi:hypothetical protein
MNHLYYGYTRFEKFLTVKINFRKLYRESIGYHFPKDSRKLIHIFLCLGISSLKMRDNTRLRREVEDREKKQRREVGRRKKLQEREEKVEKMTKKKLVFSFYLFISFYCG